MSLGKFTFTGAGLALLKPKLFSITDVQEDEPSRNSYFGTPVYSNIEIRPFQYQTLSGETISIQNGIVIDHVLINVSQTKNIVTTPIQGRNGTVKEYISDGDYQIEITGTISSDTNNYPETDVNELVQILRAPVAINIISEFLNWFDIHSVVVTDYSFPQTEGVRNVQEFSINLLSDVPVELADL